MMLRIPLSITNHGGLCDTDLIGNVMAHLLQQDSEYLAHVPNDRVGWNSFSISIKRATRMHISEFLRFATSDVAGLEPLRAKPIGRRGIARNNLGIWVNPQLGKYETRLALKGRKERL